MAVKINLMPEKAKNDWQATGEISLLSPVAAVLFIISALALAGTYYYKNYYLQGELDSLQAHNQVLTDTISSSFEDRFISLNKKAKDVDKILAGHMYWSNYFDTLENYTLKNITYNQFFVDMEKYKQGNITTKVIGEADDFKTLAKQLAVLRSKSKEFSDMNFDGAELNKEGKITFTVFLSFDPSLIKFHEEKKENSDAASTTESTGSNGQQ